METTNLVQIFQARLSDSMKGEGVRRLIEKIWGFEIGIS